VTAPGQPGYVAPSGQPGYGYYNYQHWWLARVMFAIGALCFLIAALTYSGTFHGPYWAWAFGGLAACAIAKAAVP
jgi:hypothetical protein